MPARITTIERRARLAERHRLTPSARTDDDLVAVARSVVALHATDPSSVVLSTMARMREPNAMAVEHALYEDRHLVRMMAMRRTLFTCAAEDASLLQRSSSDAVAAAERRRLVTLLEQKEVTTDATRWLADVETKTMTAIAALHLLGRAQYWTGNKDDAFRILRVAYMYSDLAPGSVPAFGTQAEINEIETFVGRR